MKTEVTFGRLLAIMSVLVLPLLGWGVSVETRFESTKEDKEDISENKKSIKDIKSKLEDKAKSDNANFVLVLEKLHDIELQVKDKKDRD